MSRVVLEHDDQFIVAYLIRENLNLAQQVEDDQRARLVSVAPAMYTVIKHFLKHYPNLPLESMHAVCREIEKMVEGVGNASS